MSKRRQGNSILRILRYRTCTSSVQYSYRIIHCWWCDIEEKRWWWWRQLFQTTSAKKWKQESNVSESRIESNQSYSTIIVGRQLASDKYAGRNLLLAKKEVYYRTVRRETTVLPYYENESQKPGHHTLVLRFFNSESTKAKKTTTKNHLPLASY